MVEVIASRIASRITFSAISYSMKQAISGVTKEITIGTIFSAMTGTMTRVMTGIK
jgi:hypothetical protein